MITDAFDNSEVLFGTKDFYGEQKHLCDKCMIIFSEQIFEYMLDTYEHQEVGAIRCCNGITPVYVFDIEGMKIAGYLSHIGSALAGGDVIEVNWLTGAVKFVMFGSAGSLDSGLTTGKFVIPTHSYREEGLSYHYAPPADYIEVKNAKTVKAIFDELKLPNVLGKVWTTDAIYRETKAKFDARKKEGCIAVEMELAGVQAVCDFYGWELYNFLVTGDVLDQEVYDVSGLADANHNMDKLYVAIEIAKEFEIGKEHKRMIKKITRDPMFLAQKSVDATEADKQVISDLLDTLRANLDHCVGMAANMIGVSKNIIVVAAGPFQFAMINPVITKKTGAFQTEEGCLSLDGVRPCTRYKEIEVDYLDTNFKKQHGKYIGWTAQIIQHEVDHCNGIVI